MERREETCTKRRISGKKGRKQGRGRLGEKKEEGKRGRRFEEKREE